jgi:hypothetical protein
MRLHKRIHPGTASSLATASCTLTQSWAKRCVGVGGFEHVATSLQTLVDGGDRARGSISGGLPPSNTHCWLQLTLFFNVNTSLAVAVEVQRRFEDTGTGSGLPTVVPIQLQENPLILLLSVTMDK